VCRRPNWPGRCSHVCNGGFIVNESERNQGIGRLLGESFILLARDLGYRQSQFNLVFVNNEPSIKLWRSLGFKETGRIPDAGRLKSGEFVDAIQFYFCFVDREKEKEKASAAAGAGESKVAHEAKKS
jgi:L-amino acid N-acyltransferase YncA